MCSLIANDATPKQTDEENWMPCHQFDLMTPYILKRTFSWEYLIKNRYEEILFDAFTVE